MLYNSVVIKFSNNKYHVSMTNDETGINKSFSSKKAMLEYIDKYLEGRRILRKMSGLVEYEPLLATFQLACEDDETTSIMAPKT